MENRARRNLFMSTTLVCLLMAAAFKFDNGEMHWFWSGQPLVGVVLVVLGIVLGAYWFRSERRPGQG
jgi:hypothetical protein